MCDSGSSNPRSTQTAGGVSATHHSAGRIDADHVQVRRAICWNDQTLAEYHAKGLARLGAVKSGTALDRETEALLVDTLRGVADDHTCIIVAHSSAVASIAERVITLG